jgi:hypothetical protein
MSGDGKECKPMWVYTTNNEMINVSQAERIELRQETDVVAGEAVEPAGNGDMIGISIVVHFPDKQAQLAFIPAAPNFDVVVARYLNAIRTAMKSRAEVCDLMDIA